MKVNSVIGDGEVLNKYVMNNISQERRQISHKHALKRSTFSTVFAFYKKNME